MNRLNVFLTGILAGAILAALGFILTHGDKPAYAEANGEGGGGLILATPSSTSADLGSLVYVLKTSPPEDATLTVYKVNQGKELNLVASRRIVWDLKAYDYAAGGGKPLSVSDAQKIIEEEERKRKDKKDK